jgi:hypothetical protein
MTNNSEITVDLPRSNIKVICQQYKNDNWKLYLANKEHNKITTIERSFTTEQAQSFLLFLTSVSSQKGIYKNTNDAIETITRKLKSIKENYVQTKNV